MPTYDFAGTGALSSDWTQSRGTVVRDSDHGESSGIGAAYWNAVSFDNDHYSEADVYLVSAGFASAGVVVRAGNDQYYGARLCPDCGNVEVAKRFAFSDTFLADGGTVTTTMPAGPIRLRLECEGTALRAYLDGVLAVSTTDSDLATGAPGVLTSSLTATYVDNWEGDDLAPAGTTITPSQASGTGTAQAPSLRTSPTITPSNVSGTGSAQAPSVRTSPTISPAQASGTGTAQAPTVVLGAIISPANVSRTGSAQAPTLTTTALVAPANVSRTGTAGSPTIQTVEGGATNISATTAYGYGTAGSPLLVGVDPPGVLWRIGGYQSPSYVSRSTGARALSSR